MYTKLFKMMLQEMPLWMKALILVKLAFVAGVIYIAVHFITKYW